MNLHRLVAVLPRLVAVLVVLALLGFINHEWTEIERNRDATEWVILRMRFCYNLTLLAGGVLVTWFGLELCHIYDRLERIAEERRHSHGDNT